MKENIDILLLGATGIIVGIFGIGYAVSQRNNVESISDKLDKALDDLAECSEIELSETIVQKALNRAVEREADLCAKKAVQAISGEISQQVKNAVETERTNIRKSVKDEIARKIAEIDVDDIKEKIISHTKEEVSKKLDSNLNDILEEHKRSVKHISQIYSTAADILSGNHDTREIKLRIG